jgi:hypothetical protein
MTNATQFVVFSDSRESIGRPRWCQVFPDKSVDCEAMLSRHEASDIGDNRLNLLMG